jgi:hypothetical protein
MFELNDRTHRSACQCPHKKDRADETVTKSKQKERRGEKERCLCRHHCVLPVGERAVIGKSCSSRKHCDTKDVTGFSTHEQDKE